MTNTNLIEVAAIMNLPADEIPHIRGMETNFIFSGELDHYLLQKTQGQMIRKLFKYKPKFDLNHHLTSLGWRKGAQIEIAHIEIYKGLVRWKLIDTDPQPFRMGDMRRIADEQPFKALVFPILANILEI